MEEDRLSFLLSQAFLPTKDPMLWFNSQASLRHRRRFVVLMTDPLRAGAEIIIIRWTFKSIEATELYIESRKRDFTACQYLTTIHPVEGIRDDIIGSLSFHEEVSRCPL